LRSRLAIATVVYYLGSSLFQGVGSLERCWLFTLLVTGVLIGYFDLRGRALVAGAGRGAAAGAAGAHPSAFLFNSINAVLSLMRQDPKRAETVLEDLADLFRV
jgi:two-component system sensor histidine kinase AlgZ